MTFDWVVAVAVFAFVTCFTPGPNNTMLMASGLNFGFARSLPHVLGVSLGFAAMVLAVALGISGVFRAFPDLYTALKLVSIVYLLWLAWRIANAAPKAGHADGGGRPFTFVEAAAFQWINPKAWVMALGASTTYVLAGNSLASVSAMAIIFAFAGLGSSSTWTFGGTALRRLVDRPALVRSINIALALLLVASLWPTVVELWTITGEWIMQPH